MTSRSSIFFSFLLATLLAAGAVELFYRALDKAMTKGEVAQTQTEKKLGPNFRSPASVQAAQKRSGKMRADYTIISRRNLFGKVETTTNTKTVVEAQPVLTTTSLDLTLLGTIGGNENDQRAIIRDKKKKTQDIYYRGDAIANALIKEITRGQIILTLNGKDEVLLMEEAKSPPGTGKKQSFSMPEVIKPRDRQRNAENDIEPDDTIDDDLEMEGDGPSDDIPPLTTPRRIMKPKPKTHR